MFTMEIRRERQPVRRILMALTVLGVALGTPRPGAAQSGSLQQLAQPAACTLEDGDGVHCADGVGLSGAYDPGISQDGKSVYVAGLYDGTLAVFSRHTSTGVLTQLPAPDGCLAENGDGITCTDAVGLNGAASVIVSSDDKFVYVGSGSGIAVFARNRSTGQLTQLPGIDGCLLQHGGGGTGCVDIEGPIAPVDLLLSPDGNHLYAASSNGDALGVFARDRLTGVLTQLAAPAGCIAETGDGITCMPAVGLDGAHALTVSRNGKQLYVASLNSDAIAVFERDRSTGALTQFPAPNGCIAENGDGVTCTAAIGLDGPRDIEISRTGRQLYVASQGSHTIAIFARDAATGVLTQLAAPAGCIAANGDGITCTDGTSMNGPTSIVVSNNGRHVYVTAVNSDAVAVFARDNKTGALTQLPAPHGCVSATGSGGACTVGVALDNPFSLAMPKSAKHLYVTSYGESSIAAFARIK